MTVMVVASRLVPLASTVPSAWILLPAGSWAVNPSPYLVPELVTMVRVKPSRSVTVTVAADTLVTVPSMCGRCGAGAGFFVLPVRPVAGPVDCWVPSEGLALGWRLALLLALELGVGAGPPPAWAAEAIAVPPRSRAHAAAPVRVSRAARLRVHGAGDSAGWPLARSGAMRC